VSDIRWANSFFRRIAIPRLPGSESLESVETAITHRLIDIGYDVTRERFTASDRSLVAAALVGAGFGWIALLISPLLIIPVPGWPVAITALGATGLVGLLAVGIHRGLIRVLVTEAAASNIIAKRGHPRIWLVAHSDSKAQSLSLAGRVISVTALGLWMLWMFAACVARMLVELPWWAVMPGALLGVLAGAAISRGTASNQSPGAVDNATGVVAVLAAAELLQDRSDVGVIVTGAEEYSMAGASVWTNAHQPTGMFINFDGIDSRGTHRLMTHAPRVSKMLAAEGQRIVEKLRARINARGYAVIVRPLPPGILEDGIVLARSGMVGVTISRGDWSTLRVVHTDSDRAERVDVSASLEVACAAAEAVGDLLG
jgi:hypothetical protein